MLIQFDNIVPTGLATRGNTIYMAEAGPVPHLPEDGKVVSFKPKSPTVTEVASGAPLLVDVEFGRGRDLYALSQGEFPVGGPAGAPAKPNTGSLVKVNGKRRLRPRRRRPRPADLGRIHQEHRLRGHARRGDLEGREPLGPAARRVALRHQDSGAARGTGASIYPAAASAPPVTKHFLRILEVNNGDLAVS